MFGKHIFEEVTSELGETIANSPVKDIEKSVKAMPSNTFDRMDLATREEFNIQQQVLIKTRTKLVELEERLAKLESARTLERTVLETAETTGQTKPTEWGRLKNGNKNETGC